MRFFPFSVLLLSFLMPLAFAQAEPTDTATTPASSLMRAPILVELFTSQSCSSCPRAEKLFAELAERDDLVVIEWHVDYWNALVDGRDGHWVDPLSARANTERQRDYNYALRNTGSVYTPQAVIAGSTETTGSQQRSIETLIERAPHPHVKVSVSSHGDEFMVSVAPLAEGGPIKAEVVLVEMISSMSNEIHGGENKGLTASSRNVAIGSDTLGAWTGAAETYRAHIHKAEADQCAVLVQEIGTGQILGASYCPPMATGDNETRLINPDFIDAHP